MKLEPISKSEAARYMGISGDLDPQIQKILDKAEETARNELIPKYVYRESALEFRTDGVYISGMSSPLTGKDIVNQEAVQELFCLLQRLLQVQIS